jgi:putative SOS response-associated peptidase YedK
MPLILDHDLFSDWLDYGINPQSLNELMANGFTRKKFKAHPVSGNFYKKGIDTNKPYIIEPVQRNTLF